MTYPAKKSCQVLSEAGTLYDRWPKLAPGEKRKITEAIIEKIVISEGEIDLMLSYLLTSEELCKSQRRLGALLGITQRTIRVIYEHSGGRFSPRKLIPVNPKTLGDHLLLKRIEANLSQPEVAVNAGVSELTVSKWEHDKTLPTEAEWRVLAGILRLDSSFPKS
jgi:hypothetical protein